MLAFADLRFAGRNLDEAAAEYTKLIQLDPKDADAHSSLADVLVEEGHLGDGISEYREAVRLNSKNDYPHFRLAQTLKKAGRLDEAVLEYREAIRIDPQWKDTLINDLGTTYAMQLWNEAWKDAYILGKLGYKVNPQIETELENKMSQPKH